MKNKTINGSAVTASSWFDERTGPEKAMLDMWEKIDGRYYAGWRAGTDDDKQWLQVNLGRVMKITRIATQQGRYYNTISSSSSKNYYHYSHCCWVTSYSVSGQLHDQEDFHDYENKVRT